VRNLENELLQFLLWCEKHTIHPDIKDCILEIFLKGRSALFAHCIPVSCSEDVKLATIEQDGLDRMQFHKGRISSKWLDAQSHFMQRTYPSKKFNRKKWGAQFVYQLFRIHHSLWRKRCLCVHNRSNGIKRVSDRAKLKEQVEEAFLINRGEVQVEDRGLFENHSCEEVLAWHEDEQRA